MWKFFAPWNTLKQRRRAFCARALRLSDDDFVARLGCNVPPSLISILRRALANTCHVDAELIYPDDVSSQLARLMGSDAPLAWLWDMDRGSFEDTRFVMELEELLPAEFQNRFAKMCLELHLPAFGSDSFFFWRKPEPSVGEWLCDVSGIIVARIPEGWPPHELRVQGA